MDLIAGGERAGEGVASGEPGELAFKRRVELREKEGERSRSQPEEFNPPRESSSHPTHCRA